MEGARTISETIPDALGGERLDRVVALVADVSRARAVALLDAGAVRCNDTVAVDRARRLTSGDRIEIRVPAPEPSELLAEPDVEVPVLHEDEDLIVVDKPAGMVVHPGAGHRRRTMVQGLLARYPELAAVGATERPGVVHRLDRGTSGLLVVARTPVAYEALVAQLAGREVERQYDVLVWGRIEEAEGLIDAPVGRAAGERTRMAVTAGGREARTRYEVVEQFTRPAAMTRVRCRLETGRTHQIRVHLAAIGHPVVGDERYGGQRESIPLERPFLHATRLSFRHPTTGLTMTFTSELPSDLREVLDGCS